MQGVVVFMPQNPQQGSPPPNSPSVTNLTMDISSTSSPEPNSMTKAFVHTPNQSNNQTASDSGIFSTTSQSGFDAMELIRDGGGGGGGTTSPAASDATDPSSGCSSPERKYVCPICETMLTSQHEFTLHIRSHNNETPETQLAEKGYACRICRKVLSSSSSLDRHVLVHSGERPFHCKYCGDSFTTNGNMHRHMRTHSHHSPARMDVNYESDSSVESIGADSAKSGTECNNNNNNNKIDGLKRKLDDRSADDGDDEQSFGGRPPPPPPHTYKCPVCERTDFDALPVLETHLEDNHPDYPARCSPCNQTFHNHRLLALHRGAAHGHGGVRHHITGFKDLTFVDFSSEKFPHIARYECERNVHKASAGGLRFQCAKCQRAFPCATSVEIHEAECAPGGGGGGGLDLTTHRVSSRDIKRNEFFARLNLQDNSPEKPAAAAAAAVALQGDASARLRQQLLAKAVTMDSPKDLADIQSIISMTTNGSLLHQLQPRPGGGEAAAAAEGGRAEPEEEMQDVFAVEFRKMKLRGEFPCRLCTAVFPNLRALKGHNRAHLNGNSGGTYRCNMCPHSSIDKAALIRHMRTHNGDRPYECSLCNYAFTTKANCERHLRNRHAKTTREEVKKAIIYHPSEDPTNEDLNKLARDDPRKQPAGGSPPAAPEPDKGHGGSGGGGGTPKSAERRVIVPEINHTDLTPLIADLHALKGTLTAAAAAPPPELPKTFAAFNDVIRNENLKAMKKEHKLQQNGPASYLPTQPYSRFSPLPNNVSTPYNNNNNSIHQSKIQVKSLDVLKESHNKNSGDHSDNEEENNESTQEEPINLVLDLSKKKSDLMEKKIINHNNNNNSNDRDRSPQDLSKKLQSSPLPQPLNVMSDLFAQQLLKTPPKLDPATLYATQLALCRNTFSGFPNWPSFPLNPLLFQTLQTPMLPQDPQELKERLQRYQYCGGGGVIADNFAERLKNLQSFRNATAATAAPFNNNGYKMSDATKIELKMEGGGGGFTSSMCANIEDTKPLNIETNFSETMTKLQSSPIKTTTTTDMQLQSPNSVKMVIKNGVLMPKQKQRRYRTERPFTCEHCSARFTLRSNMERHIKQQHPQFWSQRQRGGNNNVATTPGRKSQCALKSAMCGLNIPNYEPPKHLDEVKDHIIDEKIKFAILAQHLRANQHKTGNKKEEDDECALVIDENDEKCDKIDEHKNVEQNRHFEDRLKEWHQAKKLKLDHIKNEDNQDLVSVSKLLDNASQQQFKDYFKRENEDQEMGGGSEEDEEGLVASGSTSEGNISGTDENRSESETAAPVKKKSAYSMAPNRVSCPYCSRKFPWTSSLRRHILTHTGQKPFKCSHCPLLFTTKSNCDRHLLRKHGNTATTITNDTATNNNNNNNNNNTNYLMRNVPERPFKCSNCPSSTFSTYSNLKKHISCKHATNAQGDDIRAQGYEAGSSEDEIKLNNNDVKNEWDAQIASGRGDNCGGVAPLTNSDLPFKCHLCDGSFGERQDALDHIKDKHFTEYDLLMSKNALDSSATIPEDGQHHDDDENEIRGKFPDYSNRKVICAFCMRRFWSAEDLRRHMRTHTGERPFSCDICSRRFTLKHSMLRHRKKHNVNFDNDNGISDEDNNIPTSLDKYIKNDNNNLMIKCEKTEESDGNEGGDLISNLLGIRDRSFIDKVLTASADDAAKLLGVKNGVKE